MLPPGMTRDARSYNPRDNAPGSRYFASGAAFQTAAFLSGANQPPACRNASNILRRASDTSMDAGDPAMCGRLVITRWNSESDSAESRVAYFASAARSCAMARLENHSRVSEPLEFPFDCGRSAQPLRNTNATAAHPSGQARHPRRTIAIAVQSYHIS